MAVAMGLKLLPLKFIHEETFSIRCQVRHIKNYDLAFG